MKESNLLHELTAISSIDGRYGSKTFELRNYFSEYALIKYRVIVEIEYFKALCDVLPQLKDFDRFAFTYFDHLIEKFSLEDAKRIKELEKTTNHDVKAVEYWLREKFDVFEHPDFGGRNISYYKEFIHFGLTSYDINSPAWNMMIRDGLRKIIRPMLHNLLIDMSACYKDFSDLPMLAHTHGQPASPTTLGKEICVFISRLDHIIEKLDKYSWEAKFGGATGNFNAHYVAYPKIDWHTWADTFLTEKLGLTRQSLTTQIEHYDNLAELFDLLKRINTVFIDLSRDMWSYISMGYFNQKVKKDEVGSSAMPHKVNPIDFENAEGNAGIATVLFEFLSTKLPVSRLQRDLSGSTVERIIGVPFAHTLIAISSLKRAFGKVEPNLDKIHMDLENNWAVVAEGIQTILRREMYPDPYKVLKELTRKGEIGLMTPEIIHEWVDQLDVSNEIKHELKAITPFNYVGR
ncbi:MAG: adenylosuccinate lyase [bacterium]